MIVQYEFTRDYLFTALDAGPVLFENLLQNLTSEESDFLFDPERFTLREMIAHVANAERVFQHRLTLTRDEDTPTLPITLSQSPPVEDRPFVDLDYTTADPAEQLTLFRQRRADTITFLHACSSSDWDRIAIRPDVGPLTLEALAVLIPLHDTYHLEQVLQWRAKFAAQKE